MSSNKPTNKQRYPTPTTIHKYKNKVNHHQHIIHNNPVFRRMEHTPLSTHNQSFSTSYANSGTKLPNPPSFLHRGQLQFIIMDAPTDDNLNLYIKELNQKSVAVIVRTCEPTYSAEVLQKCHMSVVDMAFPDGHPPSNDIIEQWLAIVVEENIKQRRAVAVHCVAGLGRAPVLVAIALIEIGMMSAHEAIGIIRQCRRGAINQKQYQYLKNYQRRRKNECCIVL